MNKKSIIRLLKGFTSIFLLVWIGTKIDWQNAYSLVRDSLWGFYILAFMAIVLNILISVLRWKLILLPKNIVLPYAHVLRVVWISNFFSNYLPSLGGDAVRAYGLIQTGLSKADVASSVLIDRLIGASSLVILSVFGSVFGFFYFGWHEILYVALLPSLLILTIAFFVWNQSLFGWLFGFYERIPKLPGKAFLAKAYNAVHFYGLDRRGLLVALFLSFVIQITRFLNVWFCCYALRLIIDPVGCFILFFPIALAIMIPISFGGWGVQEGLFVYFFTLLGIDAAAAFGLGLISHIIVFLGNAPGCVFFYFKGFGESATRKIDDPKETE